LTKHFNTEVEEEFSPLKDSMLFKYHSQFTNSGQMSPLQLQEMKQFIQILRLSKHLCKDIERNVAQCTIHSIDQMQVHLKTVETDATIGHLTTVMEGIYEKYEVEDYSCSQTSLEQIFNKFA